ncbi:P-II family nitrogen regulator [Lignipirellula cremea]|uniref:Membrane-associated protein n=1 Tax=Lignipirellula cremea TaxID=2528010 RepID=A0A518DZU7_9BACT|nr:hypothetical protein [Lignipirellula cremea]QDU97366.1 hypothetical protein Pla8534_52120 [Lignipirellula cremea]
MRNEKVELTKVIVVTETQLEDEMLTHFKSLGIKGFTCMSCWGQGHHQVYDEPFIGHSQTRIEIVTTEAIADEIVDYCRQDAYENRAVSAYFELVQVRDPERFV